MTAALTAEGLHTFYGKSHILHGVSLSVAEGFAETAPWSLRVFQSDEAAEGMAAFREKRKPAWAAGR